MDRWYQPVSICGVMAAVVLLLSFGGGWFHTSRYLDGEGRINHVYTDYNIVRVESWSALLNDKHIYSGMQPSVVQYHLGGPMDTSETGQLLRYRYKGFSLIFFEQRLSSVRFPRVRITTGFSGELDFNVWMESLNKRIKVAEGDM